MSIYRSQKGRRELEGVYTDAVDQLTTDVEDHQIETRHGSTYVLVAGPSDGPPIVLFHGGNATNPMTLSWYTGLADEYRLIAPDTIGQPGKSSETRVAPRSDSYGEWVVDILDAFGIQEASMIGTSYGGGVMLRTAALAPERIKRTVLVVPAGFGMGSLVSMMRVGVPSMCYRYLPSEWLLDRVLTTLVTRSDPDPVVRDTIAASLRYVKLEREFPRADKAELERFAAPVALFVAEDDPFFSPQTVIPRAHELLLNLVHTEILSDEKHILSPRAQNQVTMFTREFFKR